MKFLLKFIMVLFPAGLLAQDSIPAQDPAAVPYLENIAKTFQAEEAYQVEFRYEIYSAMHDAKVSDYGSIIVEENKYKLKTEDTEIYYNGEYLWVHNLEAGEVYKSIPVEGDPDQMLSDPFRLLGSYQEYYKYLFKGEKTIAGNTFFQIDLYPEDLNAGYSILRIFCSEGGNEVHSIVLKQKNGTEITAFINEIIKDIQVPESTFSWNTEENPEVLVIEM